MGRKYASALIMMASIALSITASAEPPVEVNVNGLYFLANARLVTGAPNTQYTATGFPYPLASVTASGSHRIIVKNVSAPVATYSATWNFQVGLGFGSPAQDVTGSESKLLVVGDSIDKSGSTSSTWNLPVGNYFAWAKTYLFNSNLSGGYIYDYHSRSFTVSQ